MRATRKGTSKRRGRSRSVIQCASTNTWSAASTRPRARHCSISGWCAVQCRDVLAHRRPGHRAWRASRTPSSSKLSRMAAMAWVRRWPSWPGRRRGDGVGLCVGGVDGAAGKDIGARREAGGGASGASSALRRRPGVAQQQDGGGRPRRHGFALGVEELGGSDHETIIERGVSGPADNPVMRIRFTKMQGAGNDFVVLDETRGPLALTPAQYRFLADRHYRRRRRPGPVGAAVAGAGHRFRIRHPQRRRRRGRAVRQRRALLRALRARQGPDRARQRQGADPVRRHRAAPDRRRAGDGGYGRRRCSSRRAMPFDAAGLSPQADGDWDKWHLALGTSADAAIVSVAVLSMGNPHAVQVVPDVDAAPVRTQGPLIENHPRFPNRVNAGFMQVVRPRQHPPAGVGARRRRDAGLRHRRLRGGGGRHPPRPAGPQVDVETRGGMLTIEWAGGELPGDDDRPGRHRVRRRDRGTRFTMMTSRWHEPDHRRRHRQLPGEHARFLRAPRAAAGLRAAHQPARQPRREPAGAAGARCCAKRSRRWSTA